MSITAYSHVALLAALGPLFRPEAAALSLSFRASLHVVPGYGGGMSSAKAALESDTRTLAYEAAERWGVRVNTISAGPIASRAARAIGYIEEMMHYAELNAPIRRRLAAEEVANTAAFLLSPLARAITGATVYVDNGMHCMGMSVDSLALRGVRLPHLPPAEPGGGPAGPPRPRPSGGASGCSGPPECDILHRNVGSQTSHNCDRGHGPRSRRRVSDGSGR
jgi:hypothetical protein